MGKHVVEASCDVEKHCAEPVYCDAYKRNQMPEASAFHEYSRQSFEYDWPLKTSKVSQWFLEARKCEVGHRSQGLCETLEFSQ